MRGLSSPWLGVLVLAMGCARQSSPQGRPGEAPPLVASQEAPDGVPSASATLPTPPPGPYRDLVRQQRWAEAKAQLDALPEAERARPEMRYLRARVASELKEHAAVVALLAELEKQLPLLEPGIARLRAEAQLEVGPAADAAAYFAARGGLRALTRAATAYERAGKPDEARRTIDRALAAAKGGAAEAAARAVRARVAEATGARDVALADAKWILREAPADRTAEEASALVTRLDPAWKPATSERLGRADKLAAAGKIDEALSELSAASQSPAPPDEGELAHARGMALYKARRYEGAAGELSRAVARRAKTADEDAFHAARALSRANRDEEAIRAYRAIVKEDPKSARAEEASYLAARLAMLLGKLEDARAAYASHLKRYKRGKHAEAATYELALVHVAEREFAKAQRLFGELARAEDNKQEAARLRELEGAAAQKAGDSGTAKAAFQDVIRAQPLSFSALAARARLAQMGAPLPAPIEPAEAASSPPLGVKLPPAAELLHLLGLDDEAEDALRAKEKELAQAAAPRGVEALCAAYGTLDHATRRYRIAQDQVKAETLRHEPSQATRWAWECLYPRPYADDVRRVESREGLPAGIVHAVMRQESGFDVDVVSPANAVGLLQLLPTTAREIAKRSDVPFEEGSLVKAPVNVDLGARYLSLLVRMWKGSLPLAIASYNAGPSAVSRWLEHAGDTEVDFWVARIPYGETRTYVGRVMGNFARYRYLESGVAGVPELALAVDTSLRAEPGAF